MSFIFYDIIFLIIFSLFLFTFFYVKRKKLKREGIIFLYRTKLGIEIINYIGKHYKKFLNSIKYLVIFVGYILMIAMLSLLGQLIYIFIKFPEFIKAVKIPPVAPLIPYLPSIFKVDFLPPFYFTYWILTLAIVAIGHEFSHGIFSKLSKIKIKSTGFFFLGPFFGAFVEPDEKEMKKKGKKNQIVILSAGSFTNCILALLFFIILLLFFISSFTAYGVLFDNYAYNIINKSDISYIGKNISISFDGDLNLTEIKAYNKTYFIKTGAIKSKSDELIFVYEDAPALKAGLKGVIISLNNVSIKKYDEFKKEILKYKPGDNVSIKTLLNKTEREYEIILTENPSNKSQGYIGIATIRNEMSLLGKIRAKLTFFKDQNTYYSPKFNPELIIFIYNLLWWIVLINISVALTNMLPVGIFDGGRVFYLTMLKFFNEKKAKKIFSIVTYLILSIFILLTILWAFTFFNPGPVV